MPLGKLNSFDLDHLRYETAKLRNYYNFPQITDEQKFWIAISFLLLILSAFLSHFSLLGDFRTYQFGVKHQWMWDPDGPYLSSGIFFFRVDKLDFHGHPGLILQMLIGIVSESMFLIAKFLNCPVGYEKFIVKNYYWLVFFSRTILTAVHLCSFFVLYRICIRLMSSRAALLAVCSYATTYTLIFYINRISPEVILILSMLLAIFSFFKYQEQKEKECFTILYIIGAAFFCSVSCFSKFMLGIPFSLALMIYLFALIFFDDGDKQLSKIRNWFVFCSFMALFVSIMSLKIDILRFFEFWFKHSPVDKDMIHPGLEGSIQMVNIINSYFQNYIIPFLSYKTWLPQQTKMGLFVLAESVFAVVSIVGGLIFFKKNRNDRWKTGLFIIIIICTLPIVIYRNDFHYYFLYTVFASIFCGYIIAYWLDTYLTANISEGRKFIFGLLIVGLIHCPGLMISLDGKIYNMKQYYNHKKCISSLRTMEYSEKLPKAIKKTALMRSLGFQYYTTSNSLKEAASYYVNSEN